MVEEKGKCSHGEFALRAGCSQCVAEKRIRETAGETVNAAIAQEAVAAAVEEPDKLFPEQPETTALIQVYPHGERDVIGLLNEAQKVADKAKAFSITSEADVKLATNDLSIIAGLKKKIEAKKKEYLAPLEQYKKDITFAFAQLLDPITFSDKTLREKTSAYLAEVRRKQEEATRIAEEEAALARRKAELTGEAVKETEMIPTPSVLTTHRAELGTASQMDVWKWEIIDPNLIPRHYMKVDDAAITKAVRASHGSIVIAGIRVFNEPTLRVEARKS